LSNQGFSRILAPGSVADITAGDPTNKDCSVKNMKRKLNSAAVVILTAIGVTLLFVKMRTDNPDMIKRDSDYPKLGMTMDVPQTEPVKIQMSSRVVECWDTEGRRFEFTMGAEF
jgi:hypothetical protein